MHLVQPAAITCVEEDVNAGGAHLPVTVAVIAAGSGFGVRDGTVCLELVYRLQLATAERGADVGGNTGAVSHLLHFGQVIKTGNCRHACFTYGFFFFFAALQYKDSYKTKYKPFHAACFRV